MATEMDTDKWIEDTEPSDRAQYRRYRKRNSYESSVIMQEEGVGLGGGEGFPYPNTTLLIEGIKQEAENFDAVGRIGSPSEWRTNIPHFLRAKSELDDFVDSADSTFSRFASGIDAALQGAISIPDLILQYENTCREVADQLRDDAVGRFNVAEERLMRQKLQLISDEAATWSLVWYLYGKSLEDCSDEVSVIPSTSQQEACDFAFMDHTAQLCLRICQWLERLASKSKGWYAGSYLHKAGFWHQTQRQLRKKVGNATLVHHLDFDAPTREQTKIHVEDQKQEQALLEDVWLLLRAGKLKEACDLCCSSGQAWRAATLCSNWGFEPSPSMEALTKTGKNRILQAIELDSGLGYQRRLWKWTCYHASERISEQESGRFEAAIFASQCSNLKRMLLVCSDWESACWAMVKSWLDFQVDLELSRLQQSASDNTSGVNFFGDIYDSLGDISMEATKGPESWPLQVIDQQPRDLQALFQKLHSNELVQEAVSRSCKEQHRQIQMDLMLGDVAHLLGLLKTWIVPPNNENMDIRFYGHPQTIRFGAHLVLVLRKLLTDDSKDIFREKLQILGDLILYTYTIFLFSQKHEELVGLYASQLAPHLCVELYVLMMELRLKESLNVKYTIFCSAMEYLPFFPCDTKGCVSEILDRMLLRSREPKPHLQHVKTEDPGEQHHERNLDKARTVQWCCLPLPATIPESELIKAELVARALHYSNILFREFSLVTLWRSTKIPDGAHMLLSFFAEPLRNPSDLLLSLEHHNVAVDIKEFENWKEYYACDALYRNWLGAAMDLEEVPPGERSLEEKEREASHAKEALTLALSLLQDKEDPWLYGVYNNLEETVGEWIELQGIALLRKSDGDCLLPDATICTALTSAFYFSAGDYSASRKFFANVSICPKDNYCIEVVLRCLAVEGDGNGACASEDGGLLASVMGAAFKGELKNFMEGITLEVFQLDSWFMNEEGSRVATAEYIILGLCRRCCIPEIILRCMQMRVSLAGIPDFQMESQYELAELVASSDSKFYNLFSRRQLQEFLLLEREFYIRRMEVQEEE